MKKGLMEKIGEDYTTYLGNTKNIYRLDKEGSIIKVFKTKKQILPIQEQRKIIEKKMRYFGEYIPQTELIETKDGEYVIKQKFIKGKTLSQIDVSDLSVYTLKKLIDLINKYLKYHKEQGGIMDITGYQYYPGNITNIKRKIKNFLKIKQNFLVSTNIMVSEDGNVYMVDVCETTSSRLEGKIKNICAKPFIKSTIKNLENILKSKLETEKSIVSNDLVDVLDS